MREIKHSVTLKKDSKADMHRNFLTQFLKDIAVTCFVFKIKEENRRQFSSHLLCQNFKSVNWEPDGKNKHFFTEKFDSDIWEELI